MEAGSGGPGEVEVWRGKRRLVRGGWGDVLALGRAGKLRHSDELVLLETGARFAPHDVPALVPLVAGQTEARLGRNLRALLLLNVVLFPLAVLGAWAALGAGVDAGGMVPFYLLLYVLLFLAPIPALRAQRRRLAALRARGLVPEREIPGAPVRTTGDARLDAVFGRRARLTPVVVGVIAAVSVIAFFDPDLLALLAKDNARIHAGEWWRLVTPLLVHGSLLHLAMNGMALLDIGSAVELLYGRMRMLVLFVVGTAGASAASVAFSPMPSVGASGGLFALVGALIVFGVRHRHALAPAARNRLVRGMLWVVALNLVLGFSMRIIDNAAHIGGLVTGLLLGALLPPAEATRAILLRRPGAPPSEAARR